ncbi:MAG: hypothetical protein IIA41_04980, partial [SAR324 cluster bacterium]|nr:hypothetical protein [SAR324 cluster bacterium]
IVDMMLGEVRDRVLDHGLVLQITDKARDHLAETGYDPYYGARPLRRVNSPNCNASDSIIRSMNARLWVERVMPLAEMGSIGSAAAPGHGNRRRENPVDF